MTGQETRQSRLYGPIDRAELSMDCRFTTFAAVGSGMSYEDYEWILLVEQCDSEPADVVQHEA